MKGVVGETKERTSIGPDLCYKCIFCMIPIIASIFIIKIAEFAHVLFKQTGDRRQETGDRRQETGDRRQRDGEAATSCASSQIAQSLTNWVERMRRTYLGLMI